MKTLRLYLIVVVALGLSFSGSAATLRLADVEYCDALIGRYNTYAANLSEWRRTGPFDADKINAAIASCKAGDTAVGIPVLENTLRDLGIGLPARG
jgi:hypothetical protein